MRKGGTAGSGGAGGSGPKCTAGADGPSDTHGHQIEIPQAHIDDPQDRQYTSTGGLHGHTVDVTAAQFADLAATGMVMVSSSDGHAHTWMVACV